MDLTHQYSSRYAAIRGAQARLRQEVRPGTPPACPLAWGLSRNFVELRKAEVRRNPLPFTPVNKEGPRRSAALALGRYAALTLRRDDGVLPLSFLPLAPPISG